jgi:YggT family protein
MSILLRLINLVFTLYSFAIIARALMSWFRPDPYHPVVRFLIQITDPLLIPLRRYVPLTGGIDFTPMAALLILWIAEWLIRTAILALF